LWVGFFIARFTAPSCKPQEKADRATRDEAESQKKAALMRTALS
jgi:hypothetical protein